MPPKKGFKTDELKGAARFGRVKNNLKMGIVGLPNVGKSSLFNILTEQQVAAENFPFCTIDPSTARCPVPDPRFDWLCDLWKSPSKIPAFLHVTDIACLVKGAAEGAGLGNAFLSNITSCDGVFHVIRAFEDDEVIHVDDSVDPVRDLETINVELCAKDLQFVTGAFDKYMAAATKNKGKATKIPESFTSAFEKLKDGLAKGLPVRNMELSMEEVDQVNDLVSLITSKPMIYLVNVTKKSFLSQKGKWFGRIKEWVDAHGGGLIVPFSVAFEQELFDLKDDAEGRGAFLSESYGGKVPNVVSALTKIIKQGYKNLGLMNFFTAGEKEVRSWTVFGGALAPQAAGVIHTDFEKGFIKAEVVHWDDYRSLCTRPSVSEAKSAGKYNLEGKNYVMQDGDVVVYQFNATGGGKKK